LVRYDSLIRQHVRVPRPRGRHLRAHGTVPAAALFVLIGAEPHTSWLPEEIQRDEKGYVVTGKDLSRYDRPRRGWHLECLTLFMETGMSGAFAVGDARHASVKRVTSAVGEGYIAIRMVHEY
jgi:thioredoxin reductase (NADPH)